MICYLYKFTLLTLSLVLLMNLFVKNFQIICKMNSKWAWCMSLTSFFGLQIKQIKEGIFINKEKYGKELVQKFKLQVAKTIRTLMSTSIKLDKDENDKNVDVKVYRGMISSLLYLIASKSNIIFSVCFWSRFQTSSKESYLLVVKKIIRYVKSTSRFVLFYSKHTYLIWLVIVIQNFLREVDRKNISGACQFFKTCSCLV